ncbi:MAG: alpha/beta hydrolase [Candidatus Hodarchaeota archaeon]
MKKIISKKQTTVLEEMEEFIIVGEMTHRDHNHLRKLLIFILILLISLTCLHFNRAMSYEKYERVEFESSGATLYANLYYPSKPLDFQEQRPLIIYTHGIGGKRDLDLRIPIELTKRGFYVAALDYQGHGESGGTINNIDPITGVPALAQDCSRLLDKLETMPFYSDVNQSQIGLIGHSLGGMVALMNQALDPRFRVTVAWAPLTNFIPPKYGFIYSEQLINHIPINLLNKNNTQNLLIIMHVGDEALDFSDNALKIQELTNCTVIPISGFLLGGAHQLNSDEVLIKSINWFEQHFFKSDTINGPIFITFYWNYVLIFFNIVLLIIIAVYLISISSRLFFKKSSEVSKFNSINHNFQKSALDRKKQVLKIISCIGAFLLNWAIFEKIFGIKGIFFASLNMIFIYIVVKIFIRFKKPENERVKFNLIQMIKSQFKMKYIIFIIISTAYFIILYMIFSFYYPFLFIWPANFTMNFILAFLAFPAYLSIEILLRKVIYPQLNFSNTESSKTKIIIIIAIGLIISLMIFTINLSGYPLGVFIGFVFLVVIILNTKIFENMKSFYPLVIISFLIIQIFLATMLSNAIGVNAPI